MAVGLLAQGPSFEIAFLPADDDKLSVGKILEATEVIELGLPNIGNLSQDLYITNATVGWRRKQPEGWTVDHLFLGVEVDDWKLAGDKFVVQKLELGLRVTNPRDKEQRRLYLYGEGTFVIGDIEIGLFFDENHSISEDLVTFKIASAERPVSIGCIFKYFGGTEILPDGFTGIMDQTHVDTVGVELLRDGDGWSVSRFTLAMGVDAKFDIFGWCFVPYL